MNNIQLAAYQLIQSDARFIYTISTIDKNLSNIDSNYIMMCLPYIGIFTDGAEQWCRKIGMNAPTFNKEEKLFYTDLRQSHKLFNNSFDLYNQLLISKFHESDKYFYRQLTFAGRLLGFYYNIGTDLFKGEFCGNTILCAMYAPIQTIGNDDIGEYFKSISEISGKLASHFDCTKFPIYTYDSDVIATYKDYHFYKRCPLKIKNDFGLLLFSIICSINYCTKFIEDFFVEEIPQKLKFAYLQYYYICDFITELNERNRTNFYIDDSMKNREFRNCLAHYGLGQYLNESELNSDDILKGLTQKAFNLDYLSTKNKLYSILDNFVIQLKNYVLK